MYTLHVTFERRLSLDTQFSAHKFLREVRFARLGPTNSVLPKVRAKWNVHVLQGFCPSISRVDCLC